MRKEKQGFASHSVRGLEVLNRHHAREISRRNPMEIKKNFRKKYVQTNFDGKMTIVALFKWPLDKILTK